MSILIVEDNTISLKTVEMMLQSNGLETVSAKSGLQALEKLESRTDIQLVLTDLMMPDLDGYQLLEAIGGVDVLNMNEGCATSRESRMETSMVPTERYFVPRSVTKTGSNDIG